MGFGLSLINCSKTAPFLTTQWVPDHEGSTVGDGVGQSNDSFTYNKNKTQTSELNAGLSFFYLIRRIIYIMLFFLFAKRLDKKRIIVYTSSVVNREDYINVVDIVKSEKGRVGLLI